MRGCCLGLSCSAASLAMKRPRCERTWTFAWSAGASMTTSPASPVGWTWCGNRRGWPRRPGRRERLGPRLARGYLPQRAQGVVAAGLDRSHGDAEDFRGFRDGVTAEVHFRDDLTVLRTQQIQGGLYV